MKFAYLAAFLAGAMFSGPAAAQFAGFAHTAVAPIYDGTNGNTSYIRLANTSTASKQISVTVIGMPSGRDYGSFTYNLAAWASQQKSIHEILRDAGITPGYIVPDTAYSVYLSTVGTIPLGFQHIVYNASTRALQNMSACNYRPNMDYAALNRFIGNVHTDQAIMSAYPATVSIHHYAGGSASYLVDVYVAETGEHKGNFTMSLQANETFTAPMGFFEQRVNWVPVLGQSHANLVFRRDDIGPYQAVVGHRVFNAALDSTISMAQYCPINPN